MISDDYKKGWYDGYHAKNDVKFYPANTTPTLNRDVYNIPATTITGNTCSHPGVILGMFETVSYTPDMSIAYKGTKA